jgi:hypothetical protein
MAKYVSGIKLTKVTFEEFAALAQEKYKRTVLNFAEMKELSVEAKVRIPGFAFEVCKVSRGKWDVANPDTVKLATLKGNKPVKQTKEKAPKEPKKQKQEPKEGKGAVAETAEAKIGRKTSASKVMSEGAMVAQGMAHYENNLPKGFLEAKAKAKAKLAAQKAEKKAAQPKKSV